jgi:hypothetical protein
MSGGFRIKTIFSSHLRPTPRRPTPANPARPQPRTRLMKILRTRQIVPQIVPRSSWLSRMARPECHFECEMRHGDRRSRAVDGPRSQSMFKTANSPGVGCSVLGRGISSSLENRSFCKTKNKCVICLIHGCLRNPGHIGHPIRNYIGRLIWSESATQSGIISATFWRDRNGRPI